jgi:hypothetical protein
MLFTRKLAMPFLAALMSASLAPAFAGQITMPTIPTIDNGIYLNYYSSNTAGGGGSVTASLLAPGSAVTGITISGSAYATMGSDPTFDAGNGLYYGRVIFDFDFVDPLLAGTSLPANTAVPVSWDLTIGATGPDGSPIAAIDDYSMEPELLFDQGWTDAMSTFTNAPTSSLHATGSMISTIPAGWIYSGRAVAQLYVTWTAPSGSTLDITVPQSSSIDFGSVNSAAASTAPEPGTLSLALSILALAAGLRHRRARRLGRNTLREKGVQL